MREDFKETIEKKVGEILRQPVSSIDLLNIVYVLKTLDGDKTKKSVPSNG